MSYEDAASALFQASHGEFVAERKRLSTELKASGDKMGASRLARLQRPPVTAWAVNQLYWHARDAVDAFFALADRLREGDLSATTAHREALAKLRRRAETMLSDAGHGATEATLRRIALTLSAVAAAGTWMPDGPGQLTADRDPPGFDAVGVINAPSAPLPTKVTPPVYDFTQSPIQAPAPARSAVDELAAKRKAMLDEEKRAPAPIVERPPPSLSIVPPTPAPVEEPEEPEEPDAEEPEDEEPEATPAEPTKKLSALEQLRARKKEQAEEAEEERRRKFIEDGGTRDRVIAKRMMEAEERNRAASDSKRERVEAAVRAKLAASDDAEENDAPPPMTVHAGERAPSIAKGPPQPSDLVAALAAKLGAPTPPSTPKLSTGASPARHVSPATPAKPPPSMTRKVPTPEALHVPARPASTPAKPAAPTDAERRKIDARAKLRAEIETRLRDANGAVIAAEQRVEKLTAELADADDALEAARAVVEDLRDKLDALD